MEIAIVFIVIGIPVICLTLIALAKILKADRNSSYGEMGATASKSSRRGKRGKAQDEERAALQKLYQSLNRLEQRIESLETLYIEDDRKRRVAKEEK